MTGSNRRDFIVGIFVIFGVIFLLCCSVLVKVKFYFCYLLAHGVQTRCLHAVVKFLFHWFSILNICSS